MVLVSIHDPFPASSRPLLVALPSSRRCLPRGEALFSLPFVVYNPVVTFLVFSNFRRVLMAEGELDHGDSSRPCSPLRLLFRFRRWTIT